MSKHSHSEVPERVLSFPEDQRRSGGQGTPPRPAGARASPSGLRNKVTAIGSCVSSLVSYSGSVLHVGIGTRGADVEDAWGELSEAHAQGDPTARGPAGILSPVSTGLKSA